MHQSCRLNTLTSKMTAHASTRVKSTFRFVINSKLARILLVTYTIYVAYQFFIVCHRLQRIVIVYNYYNIISFVHLHTMHIYIICQNFQARVCIKTKDISTKCICSFKIFNIQLCKCKVCILDKLLKMYINAKSKCMYE